MLLSELSGGGMRAGGRKSDSLTPRGLKFRAGLIDPHSQREINFATERELFAYLDLPYVPPRLRNADG